MDGGSEREGGKKRHGLPQKWTTTPSTSVAVGQRRAETNTDCSVWRMEECDGGWVRQPACPNEWKADQSARALSATEFARVGALRGCTAAQRTLPMQGHGKQQKQPSAVGLEAGARGGEPLVPGLEVPPFHRWGRQPQRGEAAPPPSPPLGENALATCKLWSMDDRQSCPTWRGLDPTRPPPRPQTTNPSLHFVCWWVSGDYFTIRHQTRDP